MLKQRLPNIKDYEMKLSIQIITYITTLVLSVGSLLIYCGVLKEKIHNNKIQITKLETQVIVKDKELKAEIDRKLDISVYNEAHKSVVDRLGQMRSDNIREHSEIKTELDSIDKKIDRLIERKMGE